MTFKKTTFGERNLHFLVSDAALLLFAPLVALFLRVDLDCLTEQYRRELLTYTAVSLLVKLLVFKWAGLYSRLWRYATISDMLAIVRGVGLATILLLVANMGVWTLMSSVWPLHLPRSLPILDGFVTAIIVTGPRMFKRMLHSFGPGNGIKAGVTGKASTMRRVIVAGAGDAGVSVVRLLQQRRDDLRVPVAFVDDDAAKHGMRLHGIPVRGRLTDIPRLVTEFKVDEVIIAMPSAPGSKIREIVNMCEAAGVPSRNLPRLEDIVSGNITANALREVEIDDLLRREPIHTDMQAVAGFLEGRRVMVTGSGGSIGSELCRQILRCQPLEIILLGHGENSVFDISCELDRRVEGLHNLGRGRKPVIRRCIADIRDAERLCMLFKRFQPEVIFHAAAHKHVPLMEENPCEAVSNNIFGTGNLLTAADAAGVERFVMISTDKAVNPSSVMGATKRVAEMLVHNAALRTGRYYVAVRFGNVLGSRGSVVPLFRRQIAQGGPVTVTHPDMKRFFMTIPEAVQLVLQASVLGHGGEVFMLDMGEPLKVLDLARDMIRLSGLEPNRDIQIQFTGCRPGEKLVEELFIEGETYQRTQHAKVFVMPGANVSHEALDAGLMDLTAAMKLANDAELIQTLKRLVPQFVVPT